MSEFNFDVVGTYGREAFEALLREADAIASHQRRRTVDREARLRQMVIVLDARLHVVRQGQEHRPAVAETCGLMHRLHRALNQGDTPRGRAIWALETLALGHLAGKGRDVAAERQRILAARATQADKDWPGYVLQGVAKAWAYILGDEQPAGYGRVPGLLGRLREMQESGEGPYLDRLPEDEAQRELGLIAGAYWLVQGVDNLGRRLQGEDRKVAEPHHRAVLAFEWCGAWRLDTLTRWLDMLAAQLLQTAGQAETR